MLFIHGKGGRARKMIDSGHSTELRYRPRNHSLGMLDRELN